MKSSDLTLPRFVSTGLKINSGKRKSRSRQYSSHSAVVSLSSVRKNFSAAAGHSLGEYSALFAAGALDFENALRLVGLRGRLMQHAGDVRRGTMAAIVGLEDNIVEEICKEASANGIVQPANYNSPGQIVISGDVRGRS